MFHQIVSVAGALLILGAYVALQVGWLGRDNRWFNVMNFVGAVLLAWIAVVDWRIGFILLECTWAAISVPGMFRTLSSKTDQASR